MNSIAANMDAFNRISLRLLVRLYDSFPKPFNLDPAELNKLGFDSAHQEADEEESWNIGTLGTDVVEWLGEEGFLRYEPDPNHRPGYFGKVRLTLKGLTILGDVPSALRTAEQKETLIAKVKRALASSAETAGSESIRLVVSEIFKLVLAPEIAIAGRMYV